MNAADYDHQKLQTLRKEKFTQKTLADAINCDVKTISRAETGESASFALLKQIASECDFSIKEIIFDS